MRVVEINMCLEGSTGRIMLQIAGKAREYGYDVITYSTHQYRKKYKRLPTSPKGHRYYGSYLENAVHFILARLTGRNGCFGRLMTKRLIKEIKNFQPDIIHLHNLHGFCINLPLLFEFLKKENIRVIWTLHDCWSFTGHCPHFDMLGCEKWKTGCYECSQYRNYPKSIVDNSKQMYQWKKEWFTGVKDMTLVTPSNWLAGLIKESYLSEYPVRVIPNGIDTGIFSPKVSGFRRKYHCEEKCILLGVASAWGIGKGLDVFTELAKRMDDNYQIVLIGTNVQIDKLLPENIISIHETSDQEELAEIYSAADIFINPTREDTYPTVNMEAIACGTPVITFETGGSPEIINERCGRVVKKNDVNALIDEIQHVFNGSLFTTDQCTERAKEFDMNQTLKKYMELYQ